MKKILRLALNLAPKTISTRIDILRCRSIWKSTGVVFIHVPKAAGVTVSKALYGKPLGHFTAVDIRNVCPKMYKSLFTFGVVRDPIERLHSAYRFAKSGGTSEMGIKNPAQYNSIEFRSFDSFVADWLTKQDISNIDGVFRPQHLYLCEGDKIIVNRVIKLENLNQEMLKVSSKLGREIVLGHHNKSKKLPFEIESTETLKIIQSLYHKDFEIFDYSVE